MTLEDREINDTTGTDSTALISLLRISWWMSKRTGVGNLFFKYDHFGLSFRDFDNYLPGKDLRVTIRKGSLST